LSEDQIVDELERWCAENMHLVSNIWDENCPDFMKLNKTARLERCLLKNFPYYH